MVCKNFKAHRLLALIVICGALYSSACSPLIFADRLSPYDGYKLEPDVAYGIHRRQKLDIYEPLIEENKESIIMFIYGGSWRSGERSNYRFIAQPFVSQGYTTIVPDYRLYPEVQFPAFVDDIAKAAVWAHRRYEQKDNPRKIILVGHSAGAHITALLALDNQYLKRAGLSTKIIGGWVSLAGPHAFNPLKTESTKPIFNNFSNNIKQTKPITFARSNAPPGLLLHGKRDTVVYEKNSTLLANAIKNKRGHVILKTVEDVGHIEILLSVTGNMLFNNDVQHEIFAFISNPDNTVKFD
ncbi:alpha/beta hydrolase [Rhodospirillaceae bacterium]|nr:alpha/beta hydrolase [Rhodospirillaceae bacterium]